MAVYYSGYSTGYRLRLDVTQQSQNIGNNTSTLVWRLYLESGSAYFEGFSISGTYVNINGSLAWTAGGGQISTSTYTTKALASGTVTVPHNSDGTKTVAIAAYFTVNGSSSYLPGNLSISTSMVLTSIPRASSITLSKTNITIGESVTITANRLYSAYTHTVMVWNNKLPIITLATKSTATTFSWNSANNRAALLTAIPNSTSDNVIVQIDTYNGDTLVGYERVNLLVKVPEDVRPSIGTLTVEEANSWITSIGYDKFVLGISHYRITISNHVVEGEGASFVNVRYKLGELSERTSTLASVLYDWSSNQANPKVTATITDSRGRTGTKEITIKQVPYNKPSISKFSMLRYNESDKTKLSFDLSAIPTSLKVGSIEKNPIRFAIRARKAGTSNNWTALYGFVDTWFPTLNLTSSMLAGSLPNDTKYEVKVVVQDLIGTTSEFTTILNNTSRKWFEVKDGQDISIIGNVNVIGPFREDSKEVVKKVNGTGVDYISFKVDAPTGYSNHHFHWFFTSAGSLSPYSVDRDGTGVRFHFGKLGGGNITSAQYAKATVIFYK